MEDTYVVFILVSVIGVTLLFVAANNFSGMMSIPGGMPMPAQGLPPGMTPAYRGPDWHYGGGGRPSAAIPESMGSQGIVGMTPEICTDKIDNDSDNLVDCNDIECMHDLACKGGCKIDQYTLKKPGQKICKDGVPAICKKVEETWQWVLQPCDEGEKCFGNGLCR